MPYDIGPIRIQRRERLPLAQGYVGGPGHNPGEQGNLIGAAQFRLLEINGLQPHHSVLEIGCGALVAGKHLIRFLNAGGFTGIEPNVWLLEAVLSEQDGMRELVNEKRPTFMFNEDFSAGDRRFDFILSHSILSHAAEWQLPQFMQAVACNLAANGVACVSIRFSDADGNLTGDSHDQEWVYPGTSSFKPETAMAAADATGLVCEWMPEYRGLVAETAPTHVHDWIRLRHQATFQNST